MPLDLWSGLTPGSLAIGFGIATALIAVGLVIIGVTYGIPGNERDYDLVTTRELNVTEPDGAVFGAMTQLGATTSIPGAPIIATADGHSLEGGVKDPIYFVDSNFGSDDQDGLTEDTPKATVAGALSALNDLFFWNGDATIRLLNEDFHESSSGGDVLWVSKAPANEVNQRIYVTGGDEFQTIAPSTVVSGHNGQYQLTDPVAPESFSFVRYDGELWAASTRESDHKELAETIRGGPAVPNGTVLEFVIPKSRLAMPENLTIQIEEGMTPIELRGLVVQPAHATSKLKFTGGGLFRAELCHFETGTLAGNTQAYDLAVDSVEWINCHIGSAGNGVGAPTIVFSGDHLTLTGCCTTPDLKISFGDQTLLEGVAEVRLRENVFVIDGTGRVDVYGATTNFESYHSKIFGNSATSALYFSGSCSAETQVTFVYSPSSAFAFDITESSTVVSSSSTVTAVALVSAVENSEFSINNGSGTITSFGTIQESSVFANAVNPSFQQGVTIDTHALSAVQLAWAGTFKSVTTGGFIPIPLANAGYTRDGSQFFYYGG